MSDETTMALIRRGRAVSAEIKTMTEELKEINSKLADLVPIGWKDVIDGVEASRRSSNRVFNWGAYYDQLDPNDKMMCIRTGMALVDEKLVAKHAASAGQKERFMEPPAEDRGVIKLMP